MSLEVAIYGSVLGLSVFLFWIDRLGPSLRPVVIGRGIEEGREIIAALYPVATSAGRRFAPPPRRLPAGESARVVVHIGRSERAAIPSVECEPATARPTGRTS